jgi:alkylation response protein AidB-like acyl-CoA dehydrogenase
VAGISKIKQGAVMDFELSDEQRGLVEATQSLLASKAPLTKTRSLMDTEQGYDPEVWRLGAELGWPALALPEADGGFGQGLVGLTLVAVELGRSLTATPFVPTVVVADAVARSDISDRSKILQMLISGTATAAWAFTEHGQPWSIDGIRTRARRTADGYIIDGAKALVQDANSARWLLVDALLEEQPARLIVSADSAGVRVEPQPCIDVTRTYCDITFDGVYVGEQALCATSTTALVDIERSAHLAVVLACAELTGIGQRLLDMALQYVAQRVQFGRPVGSFQAVKHKCANMRIWVQASQAAMYYAAMAVDAETADQGRAVSIAKVCASEATNSVAGEALQLHGGIGFTWEHDLHLYVRRSRTLSLLYGTPTHHREILCAALEGAQVEQPA